MKERYLIFALACFNGALGAEQAPLAGSSHGFRPVTKTSGEWDLQSAQRPSKDTSYNLVFDSVASLLKRWPNTRYRNGHTIVPGIIPAGTVLHHGGNDPNLPGMPNHPDWVATDPEHSYIFSTSPWCFDGTTIPGVPRGPKLAEHDSRNSSCWHLALAAARPLRVLYFDGSSAAKFPLLVPPDHPWHGFGGGTMDMEDVLVWGEVQEERAWDDENRIMDLCNQWGPNGTEVAEGEGFDGFVRMEMDFEVMVCDFSSSFELVSALKPAMSTKNPLDLNAVFESFVSTSVIEAGSWHNSAPGENRIHLDLPRLVSFFDDTLFPSLLAPRSQQERWEHRLQGISKEDVRTFHEVIRKNLRAEPSVSGIDWKAIFQVVTDRYAERLEVVQGLLEGLDTASSKDVIDTGKKVQTLLRTMLAPYIPLAFAPSNLSQTLKDASPAFQLCSTTTTKHLLKRSALYTPSERLMLEAIQATNKEICRVIVKAWAKGTLLGLDPVSGSEEPAPVTDIENVLVAWQNEIGGLMKWLGWTVWHKCRPACGLEEICYLPTWPFLGGNVIPNPGKAVDGKSTLDEFRAHYYKSLSSGQADTVPDWLDPQPKCVRRVAPYEIGKK